MVVALFALGVVAGVSVLIGFTQFMGWVRSRFPGYMARGWRVAFLPVALVPLGLAIDVLDGGPDLVAFNSGAAVGYFGTALWGFLRWLRRRRR
jgi:hypothetical protein